MAFSVKKKELPTLVPIVVIGSVNVLSALRFSISNITLLVSISVFQVCVNHLHYGGMSCYSCKVTSAKQIYTEINIFSTRLSSEDLSQLQGRK